MTEAAKYPHRQIFSLDSLAAALRVDRSVLMKLVEDANQLYREGKPQPKADGSFRRVFDTNFPLKPVLQSINTTFLKRVEYPTYLHGSLPGRDYKTNADLHAGSRVAISLDVKSFFPSTSAAVVSSIWRRFFGFSDEVAALLTSITCRDGALEQGAPTSSYLANLAFWDKEPALVKKLREDGFTYSRYVDDITISSNEEVCDTQLTWAIGQVIGMLASCGYQSRRSKQKIVRSKAPIVLMGLVANARKATLPKSERREICAATHRATLAIAAGTPPENLRSTLGRVYKLRRFHPTEANHLLAQLV